MKAKRHAKILQLITEQDIDTQEGLLSELRESGYNVTQATVSRDIKELRLVKSLSADGKYRYVAVQDKDDGGLSAKYQSIIGDSVISVDYAGHTVVVKCHVGMAQAACAALDGMHWDSVVGTLAGEDTIFILMRTNDKAAEFVSELYKFIGR